MGLLLLERTFVIGYSSFADYKPPEPGGHVVGRLGADCSRRRITYCSQSRASSSSYSHPSPTGPPRKPTDRLGTALQQAKRIASVCSGDMALCKLALLR
jgi:hypothetical protein